METKEEPEFDLIEPSEQWEMWLTNRIEETGVSNCGLFVEAKNEREAKKKFKALLKVIRERRAS